jgi:hypothetical protein
MKKNKMMAAQSFLDGGPYYVPERFPGSGAPGLFLEEFFGVKANCRDTPDSELGEYKWTGGGDYGLNMSHKTPEEHGAALAMLNKYGTISNRTGRKALYHTFNTSEKNNRLGIILTANLDSFQLVDLQTNETLASWKQNTLANVLLSKHRHLHVFEGKFDPNTRILMPIACTYFNEMKLDIVMTAVRDGLISVEANFAYLPDGRVKDRGFRFRIKRDVIPKLYLHQKLLIRSL